MCKGSASEATIDNLNSGTHTFTIEYTTPFGDVIESDPLIASILFIFNDFLKTT